MNDELVLSTIAESGRGSHVSLRADQLLAALMTAISAFEVAYELLDGEGCTFPPIVLEVSLSEAAEVAEMLNDYFEEGGNLPVDVRMVVVI